MTLLTLLNFVQSQPNIEDFLSELNRQPRPRKSQFSADELSLLFEAGRNDITTIFNDNHRPDAKLIMDMIKPLTQERHDGGHHNVEDDVIVNVMGNPSEISGCQEG